MSFLKSVLLNCPDITCAKMVSEMVLQMLGNVRVMNTNIKFTKVWKPMRVKLKE